MAKRSDGVFARRAGDFYASPPSVVVPLLPFLHANTRFLEPCCGEGDLVRHLEAAGHKCVASYDTNHTDPVRRLDARTAFFHFIGGVECIITNSPWSRHLLHPIMENLSNQRPTWLLLDADWVHTRQAVPLMPRVRKVVSVGRVKWFPDSKHEAKDNAVWLLLTQPIRDCPPLFYPRLPK